MVLCVVVCCCASRCVDVVWCCVPGGVRRGDAHSGEGPGSDVYHMLHESKVTAGFTGIVQGAVLGALQTHMDHISSKAPQYDKIA